MINQLFVLPDDVVLVPVNKLSPKVREQIVCEDGDYAVTRKRSRSPSKIVGSGAAELLMEFKTQRTIVDAVLSFSRRKKQDPEQILEESFPLIKHFMDSNLLVEADSEAAKGIANSFETGDTIAGYEVLRCIQVLEDTELYQVKSKHGLTAALKILRTSHKNKMERILNREASILKHLQGSGISPALLEEGVFEGRAYLVIEWCHGVLASRAAAELRRLPMEEGRRRLLKLCIAITSAYSALHNNGVIHSDVHPGNIMVDGDERVKIIDYGLSRIEEDKDGLDTHSRGGIGYYLEPEYAAMRIQGKRPPKSTMQGEQYSVAAMLYELITGFHYIDFSTEKAEMRKQIVESDLLPFSRRSLQPWPEFEKVIAKALSKEPKYRFSSISGLLEALKEICNNYCSETVIRNNGTVLIDTSASKKLLNDVLNKVGLNGSLFKTGIATPPTCSINYGEAGIAYALYRISCAREDASLLAQADIWASRALKHANEPTAFYAPGTEMTEQTIGLVSPYHTISGVYCVQALIAHAMGDMVSQKEGVQNFINASKAPCDNLDITLGRSSTLLASSILLDSIKDISFIEQEQLIAFGNSVMEDIWQVASQYSVIGQCNQIAFLGIAHGWAGLIYSALRWCQSSGNPLPKDVCNRLNQLVEFAEPIGRGVRWKRKVSMNRRKHSGDYMSGWCNGSAGFIHLWTLAYEYFNRKEYIELAERTAWNTWEDADMIPNLCCGLAGRSYGLLNIYKYTGDEVWFKRSVELAAKASSDIPKTTFYRNSLYKGEIGVAVLAADIENPEQACMPFFGKEANL